MDKNKKPLILVTNDDGVFAKGIQSLVEVMVNFGEVVVVAPDKPQSGMGHAVTIHEILRLREEKYPVEGVKAYSTSGTPVDCVKLAIYQILKKKPDLLVSGINHGANSSINVIYSGTMSAALEGAVEDIPSIGFSLLDHDANADFTASKEIVKQVVEKTLNNEFPDSTCLNVNIPKVTLEDIKGIRVCRQARAFWSDAFEKNVNPSGHEYYWMTGVFENLDKGEDTDEWALENNFVSVVPVHYDMTNHHAMATLNQWDF